MIKFIKKDRGIKNHKIIITKYKGKKNHKSIKKHRGIKNHKNNNIYK